MLKITVGTKKPFAASTTTMQFRRKTRRYGKPVGTFSSNHGYLRVRRDPASGRFAAA